ncbi:MAG TPA: hypothetical protein VHQ47_13115 [Phycisphaerae bacterium]|nr:hypothetical protein [Phycisphaerae bacterium]
MRVASFVCAAVMVSGAGVVYAAGPAARPYTVGAETTVINGPMWDDGTLDYVGAINERLSKGVTAENNAAVVLLGVFAPVGKTKEELAALGVKGGALVPAMKSLEDFALEQHLDIDVDVLGDREMEARRRPWTEKEFPVIAAWLDANKAGLARIRVGAERPRFYLPWVAEHGRGDVLSAIPLQADVSMERDALMCEAMRLAGAKDVAGALSELREVRKLGALQVQGRTELAVLEGAAAARAAWTAYAGMVTKMDLTDEQLAAVGRELEDRTIDLPERPVIDVEYLLAPGTVMSCIGGQGDIFADRGNGDSAGRSGGSGGPCERRLGHGAQDGACEDGGDRGGGGAADVCGAAGGVGEAAGASASFRCGDAG